ncbi:ABC transporter ATP-binding protein [Ruegeria pomeroyi]|uniref:ABC transporter ATP-binding protein n=1 Tax=Ruegeria pomeroyi TaxID=89184 RepID=UPI001F24F1DA|nr:ABC transporter ATP-binding protein [Ruegeria pomeroyi]MCE8509967.1 ABC transporter ATP-binding protein [Ruegeria pomeroyi]
MSVTLLNVSKTFYLKGAHKTIADNISLEIPKGKSIALLGRNGTGKSSLLNMIAGAIQPDSGQILSYGSVSWPVGFQGSFHLDLSGAQNARFLARVYGVDTRELLDFVADFAELGPHFHQPVKTYSSGMRSRLGFACSMGIHFDVYLVDEVTAVGDAAFKRKSEAIFADRLRTSGALFVSHSMATVRQTCQAGAVLEKGRLRYFEDVDEAIALHERHMGVR